MFINGAGINKDAGGAPIETTFDDLKNRNEDLEIQVEQLERDKVALMAEIQELKRENAILDTENYRLMLARQHCREMEYLACQKRDELYALITRAGVNAIRQAVDHVNTQVSGRVITGLFLEYADSLSEV